QRNISDLLASAVVACHTSANDIHSNDSQQPSPQQQQLQQLLSSDTIDDPDFERLFYMT
ncbi:unnamed protein product, partial [Rotaria sp. Silwood2]